MFESLGRGPKCPMCNRVVTKIIEINGQKGCHDCKKKIKRGIEIIPYKASDRKETKVEKYHKEKERQVISKMKARRNRK